MPPVALPRTDSSPALPAVVIGVAAALLAAAVLQLPLVWAALVSVGLLVMCGSILADDSTEYWFCVFLASIPLSITKLFFWSPDDVALIKRQLGIYVNETIVPQMYLSDLPFAMLLVLWAGEVLTRRQRVVIPRAFMLMAGFLAWALLSVASEQAPLLGAAWLVYEVKLAVMFLWFVNARLSRRAIRTGFVVLLLSMSLQSMVVGYTYVRQTGENVFAGLFGVSQSAQESRVMPARGSGAAFVFEEGALRRGTGTIGTANLEAKYFVMLLPLAAVAIVVVRRSLARAAAAAIFLLGLGALYLTYSRGGFVCAVIALAMVPSLLARGGLLRRRSVVTVVWAGITAMAVAAPVLLSFINSRPGFGRTRLDHLVDGVQLWLQNPVAGVGLNNFNVAVPPMAFDGTFNGSPIHNHYLRIAVETGAIGFALYFGFFVWATRLAFRLTAVGDRFVAAAAAALCAAMVGMGIYWVEDLFYDPIVRTQTWVLVGLIVVLARMASSDPAAPRLRLLGGANLEPVEA